MNEKTEADTICRTCLRLWQGLCDGEKGSKGAQIEKLYAEYIGLVVREIEEG